jgi:plasmid maintenance system antidote protein VapI
MTEKQAIRTAMWTRHWSQQKLADKMGYKRQTNISSLLNEERSIRFETFIKLMEVMEFEITITNMHNPDEQYIVDGEEDITPYDKDD